MSRLGGAVVLAMVLSSCLQPVGECLGAECSESDAGRPDAGRPAGLPDAGSLGAGLPDAGASTTSMPPGVYDITFVCTINCTGTYPHTMTIAEWDPVTGQFSGTGIYQVDPSYTWTVTGNIRPPNVSFTLVYTGSNRGYTARQTGTIDSSGTMSGTGTTSQNQTHDWAATRRP